MKSQNLNQQFDCVGGGFLFCVFCFCGFINFVVYQSENCLKSTGASVAEAQEALKAENIG